MSGLDHAHVHDQLVVLCLVSAALLFILAGVSGRLLARRPGGELRLATLLVPMVILIPAAVLLGSGVGVLMFADGYR